ncbi:MAG: G/U mismatch-specific DNA glycosylase [bacterium ADurb.Bin400]|nr:MAG: G/U mismatch-specific DNA glycosylase [bacterium ADurb.Bin400]
MTISKPTKIELAEAINKTVPDVIAPNLSVLFCGINPGLYTAAVGHHFARPGNRFWRALHQSGFTESLLSPEEEHKLLKHGYGITNLAARPTLKASEITKEELTEGRRVLEAKVAKYWPRWVAILGLGAYRQAFGRKNARIGRQNEKIGQASLWVLPNPSGLNAHFTPSDLARLFRELRETVGRENGDVK